METILLTISIFLGQLFKLPLGNQGGLTILDLTLIILCVYGIYSLKLKFQKPPLWIKTAFIFIAIASLSLLLTPLTLTFQQYLSAFSYTIRFSFFILFGWLVYSDAFPLLKKNANQILVISGSSLAFLGLIQFIFLPDMGFLINYGWDPHFSRTVSTFLDPNFLGSFLVLTLLALTTLKDEQVLSSIRQSNKLLGILTQNKSIFYTAFITVYLALLTTFSRGSYLTFLVGFLTFSLLNKSLRWGIVTAVLFLGLVLGFTNYQSGVAGPRNINRNLSAKARLDTWQQGFTIFQNHPVLGVGFNAYRFALKQYNLGDEQFLLSHGSTTNDSSLLYVTATTGFIGLVSYIFFLVSLVSKGNILLTAGLFGLFAQSFFANTLFYPHLFIVIILMVSVHKK